MESKLIASCVLSTTCLFLLWRGCIYDIRQAVADVIIIIIIIVIIIIIIENVVCITQNITCKSDVIIIQGAFIHTMFESSSRRGKYPSPGRP